jgi:DNA-binding transcriptional regulator YiaG
VKASLEFGYCAIATKKVEDEASSSESINRILAQTGMTKDEFADIFDTSKPVPYDADS